MLLLISLLHGVLHRADDLPASLRQRGIQRAACGLRMTAAAKLLRDAIHSIRRNGAQRNLHAAILQFAQ